jgi:hypothetical protein
MKELYTTLSKTNSITIEQDYEVCRNSNKDTLVFDNTCNVSEMKSAFLSKSDIFKAVSMKKQNIFSVDNNATMSFKEQVGHIVCLGLILLLFVNAIYFLTLRKEAAFKEYLKHPRFYAFGLSAIFYVALLAFLLLQLW